VAALIPGYDGRIEQMKSTEIKTQLFVPGLGAPEKGEEQMWVT